MKLIKIIGIILFTLMPVVVSAQKIDHDVINDFLAIEFTNLEYDSIYVQQEPIDIYDAIKLYNLGYSKRNNQNSSLAQVWVYPEIKEWPFDEKEINTLRENLDSQNRNWEKEDFKNKDFVFKSSSILEDRSFRASRLDKVGNEYVLRLSHPIFNKKKTFALFQYYFTELIMGGSRGEHRGAVIMKKEDGRWVIVGSIREAIYE